MRKIKQTIILIVVMSMVGVKAKAYGHDFKVGNIYYCLITDRPGEVKVVNEINAQLNECKSYSGTVDIPETVIYANKSLRVTEIGNSAFYKCKDLTNVSIPESVKIIDNYAFSESGIKSITIPNSVTSIRTGAFEDCDGLTSITIPNSVTKISDRTFYRCSGLRNVTIPNSVTSIGGIAFSNCGNLTYINIPNSVTSIGNEAFEYCRSLTSLEIPNSVTSIGNEAFKGCTGLTSIDIPNSVTSIGNKAFYECSKLTTVTVYSNSIVSKEYSSENSLKDIFGTQVQEYIVGNEVQSIGQYAFYGSSGLTSITIPNSVASIGQSVFSGCYGLTSVTVEDGNSTYDSRNNCNAIIETATNTLIVGCKNSVIPNSVTSIGDNAFSGCSGLTSITIPNSVTSIGNYTFEGCTALTSITIPNSVTSIGAWAFLGCTCLTSIEIPNSMTSIGVNAFRGCSGLTSITIPNSVTSISDNAFSGCSGLTSITIPNSVTSIGNYTFEGCTALTSITIPNSVTSIGYYAFASCSSLTSVTIPISVTRIDIFAFRDCSSLTTVEIKAKTPPYAEEKAFPTDDHAITLYVPRGSKAAYETANVWKDFSSIVETGVMVTADDLTMVYGDAVPELTYKAEGGSFTGTPQITCEATSISPVGTYPIVISKGTIDSDEVTYVNGKLTITKAPLTITAKSYTIKQGDALPTFEAEYNGFKNNETDAVLAKKPTLSTTATSASAPGTYEILVSSAEATNYDITYVKGTLTITKADEIVVTAKSYNRKYGEANPTFEYTSSSAALSGTPSITCAATAASPVDEYPIVITKGTVTNYNVTYVNGTLTITKAPLTIKAKSYTIKQGDDLPTFEAEYSGFMNDETDAVLTKKPTITTSATSSGAPGTYDIVVADASATNYDITFVKGTLTITQADAIIVTAKNYSREYGEANPTFEYAVSGETLTGTPSISCSATATSPVGEYDIVVSKGSVTNYNVNFVNGKLTVTKAPLTITAKNYSIKQGESLPTFEAEYSGFKNNETASVLTTQPTITTTATSASEPGTYEIIVSGASATNYNISYVKGTLTISAVEVDPVTETETTTFSEEVNENTDLSNTIIDNTYYTMNAENGDGYDATEQAIVLNSTTTAEQMNAVQNAQVGDATMQANYNGIIFEVPAGSGTITVEAKTIGSHVLNVQIGNGEPTKITKSERGTVDVPYNVTVPTYVYLYASTSGSSSAPKRAAAANSVLLYSYKVTVTVNGISVVTYGDMENAKWYTLDGLQLQGKPSKKGLYIVNGRKVVVK